ncbi:MAG: hypothetical protein DMF78_05570 [Acidobacteria bacterium]|nr:MAG: hypothetical protein DMF78_05570 [Acidobacteriota bacterium]
MPRYCWSPLLLTISMWAPPVRPYSARKVLRRILISETASRLMFWAMRLVWPTSLPSTPSTVMWFQSRRMPLTWGTSVPKLSPSDSTVSS